MPFPRLACFAGRSVRSLEHALNMNAGNFPGEVAKRVGRRCARLRSEQGHRGVGGDHGNQRQDHDQQPHRLLHGAVQATMSSATAAGSNLEAGIITALLDSRTAPFALLECRRDATRASSRPKLKPKIFNLINLFEGDQIYRFGTMDRIYDAIRAGAQRPARCVADRGQRRRPPTARPCSSA